MHGPTGIFWANLTPFSLQQLMAMDTPVSDTIDTAEAPSAASPSASDADVPDWKKALGGFKDVHGIDTGLEPAAQATQALIRQPSATFEIEGQDGQSVPMDEADSIASTGLSSQVERVGFAAGPRVLTDRESLARPKPARDGKARDALARPKPPRKLVADAEETKQQQAQAQTAAVADMEPAKPLQGGSVNPLMGELTGGSRPPASTLPRALIPATVCYGVTWRPRTQARSPVTRASGVPSMAARTGATTRPGSRRGSSPSRSRRRARRPRSRGPRRAEAAELRSHGRSHRGRSEIRSRGPNHRGARPRQQ